MPGLRLLWILVACLAAGSGCSTFASREMNADGVRLFEQSRYPEAIQQFERTIDANPNDADGYYNLAAACHRQGAFSGRVTELAQAERYYNLCLDRNPEHRECHRGLTVLLAQQGRTEEAFRRLQSWSDQNPASTDAKIELARLSEEYGDRAAARQYLAEALQIDPNNKGALNALGHLHEQSGNYAQAMADYQQSLAADHFQQDVAARVAMLQSAAGPAPMGSDSEGTRIVARDAGSLR